MSSLILAAVFSMLAADAAPAAAQAAAAPAATPVSHDKSADEAELDRVVCRNEPITGSRFNKRVCLTKREWGERTRKAEEMSQRLGERAATQAGMAAPPQ